MASRDELAVKTLDELGVTAEGQVPSSENINKVKEYITPTLEDLALRRVVYITPTSNEFPDYALVYLAMCVAQMAANAFGLTRDAGTKSFAEQMLREQTTMEPNKEPARVEYF